jgi:hypothetical protein
VLASRPRCHPECTLLGCAVFVHTHQHLSAFCLWCAPVSLTPGVAATVPFYGIVRVQKGQHTSTFGRAKLAGTSPSEHSFSIICDPNVTNGRISLDLVAKSEEERNFW